MKNIIMIIIVFISLNNTFADDVPDNIVSIKKESIKIVYDKSLVNLDFDISVKDGFFAYEEKFEVNLKNFAVSDISIDPIVTFYDQTFQKNKNGVREKAHFSVPMNLKSKEIPRTIEVILTYQACTREYCLFPDKALVTHTLTEEERSLLAPSLGPKWLKKGLLVSILFAFFAGFLTSLTPCVYPMLPITIAILGANKSTSKVDGFTKSLTYVMGMALTYAILGLFAASTGFMFGSLLSNSYFLAFLTALLFLAALGMFDVFEIQTPAFLRKHVSKSQSSTSYIALFVTGLFSGLMIGPCVGPVLVGILGYVSQTGSLITGFSLLFSFALGLGTLILVLGTFSNLIDKIPRSGTWMVWVKKVLGIVFLGLIAYFISPVTDLKLLTIICSIIVLIFSAVLLFKNTRVKYDYLNSFEIAFVKSVLISSLLIVLITASLTNERFDRLVGYSSETFVNTHWDIYSEEKLEIAKQNGMYVILDFYAEWCSACRELKHKTFSKPEISNFSTKIKWLYFDSTHNTEDLKKLKKKYNILGLPTILFFDKNGNTREDLRLTGFELPELFIKRLESLTKEEK